MPVILLNIVQSRNKSSDEVVIDIAIWLGADGECSGSGLDRKCRTATSPLATSTTSSTSVSTSPSSPQSRLSPDHRRYLSAVHQKHRNCNVTYNSETSTPTAQRSTPSASSIAKTHPNLVLERNSRSAGRPSSERTQL